MERETNPMQALCRSGCGFYGNPATEGLCSLCFKEALKKKQQPPVSAPSPSVVSSVPPPRTTFMETAQPTVPCLPAPIVPASEQHQPTDIAEESAATAAGSSVDQPENENSDKDDKDSKKKKNRCAVCRKKVGLTGFECRCGGLFCAVHRYSDKHDCSFNYREMGAQEIRRNNPVVVGEKIQKI
ncbi:PREDICTED: AN1-type zinc finger protein 6 [Nicrophorus vespilloides]|uniref:AN1-type zinc finger protein 6 n=1 Tax=Nicrophorus vespilloides TaxID=110193 RepID=A0ABM1NI62_NICVS|nr:PREDICTED: AN1-type zinc finger protein 6 [Nicrophorus vespilloides]